MLVDKGIEVVSGHLDLSQEECLLSGCGLYPRPFRIPVMGVALPGVTRGVVSTTDHFIDSFCDISSLVCSLAS